MQNQIKLEMKEWMENYCENDKKLEQQLREILLQNKYFVRNLHQLFNEKNTRAIQNQIVDYVRLKIIKAICDHCDSKNMVLKSAVKHSTCKNCNKELNPHHVQNDIKEKKCIYCNNSIAAYSNMVCSNCRKTVQFEY